MKCHLVLRAFPFKPEYGPGFGARVFDCEAKQSYPAPSKFATYEEARNWAITEAHRIMGNRPYRRASIKQSKAAQNRFYVANIWA